MKRGDRWVLEHDYNGSILTTDGVSFFAENNEGKVVAEAKSLDAVKHKILKPKKLDIDAVILTDRWSYREDDDNEFPKKVHIYAVSGAGSILFETQDGKKEKDSSGVELRQFDADKVAKYKELKKAKRDAEKGLEKLLESWPELDARELREEDEKATSEP